MIGILLCDYFLVRRSRLNLAEAYRNQGACFYSGGVNLAAVVALIAGFMVAKFSPANTMASLFSLFAAAAVYPLMRKLLYRKAGAEEEVSEVLTQAKVSETPVQQPVSRHQFVEETDESA